MASRTAPTKPGPKKKGRQNKTSAADGGYTYNNPDAFKRFHDPDAEAQCAQCHLPPDAHALPRLYGCDMCGLWTCESCVPVHDTEARSPIWTCPTCRSVFRSLQQLSSQLPDLVAIKEEWGQMKEDVRATMRRVEKVHATNVPDELRKLALQQDQAKQDAAAAHAARKEAEEYACKAKAREDDYKATVSSLERQIAVLRQEQAEAVTRRQDAEMKCADRLKAQRADFDLSFHTAWHEWQQERAQLIARPATGGANRQREQGGHASTQTTSVNESQHLQLTLTDSTASVQPADDSEEEESSSPPNGQDMAVEDPEVASPHSPGDGSDGSDGSDSDLIPATPPPPKTHTLGPDMAGMEPQASLDSQAEQSDPQAHGSHTLPSRTQARVLFEAEGREEDLEWDLDTVHPRRDVKAGDPPVPTTARRVGNNQNTRLAARHHHVDRPDHTETGTGRSHGRTAPPPPLGAATRPVAPHRTEERRDVERLDRTTPSTGNPPKRAGSRQDGTDNTHSIRRARPRPHQHTATPSTQQGGTKQRPDETSHLKRRAGSPGLGQDAPREAKRPRNPRPAVVGIISDSLLAGLTTNRDLNAATWRAHWEMAMKRGGRCSDLWDLWSRLPHAKLTHLLVCMGSNDLSSMAPGHASIPALRRMDGHLTDLFTATAAADIQFGLLLPLPRKDVYEEERTRLHWRFRDMAAGAAHVRCIEVEQHLPAEAFIQHCLRGDGIHWTDATTRRVLHAATRTWHIPELSEAGPIQWIEVNPSACFRCGNRHSGMGFYSCHRTVKCARCNSTDHCDDTCLTQAYMCSGCASRGHGRALCPLLRK